MYVYVPTSTYCTLITYYLLLIRYTLSRYTYAYNTTPTYSLVSRYESILNSEYEQPSYTHDLVPFRAYVSNTVFD